MPDFTMSPEIKEILASEQTLAGAPGGFTTPEPRTVTLKGISEPVPVVAVDWR